MSSAYLWLVLVWIVLSVPVSVAVASFLAFGRRTEEDAWSAADNCVDRAA